MNDDVSLVDEERVLLLAPTRRDGAVLEELFSRSSMRVKRCGDAGELSDEVHRGAGVIVLSDVALFDPLLHRLTEALEKQPAWSSIPVIFLCRPYERTRPPREVMQWLKNATILERPSTTRTLVSSVKAALQARSRQYQLREQFEALRLSEDSLRARERELASMTENTPDILSRFDPDMRHVFVNRAAAFLTGMDKSEFIGRTNRELGMSDELCTLWEGALRTAFKTGEAQTIEFEFPNPKGTLYFVSTLVPEMDDAGEIGTVLCVAHDRTRARQAELKLRELNRRKDEFLAMLAHELRNPLAPMCNAAEILGHILPDNDRAQKVSAVILRQGAQMTRLIDDLLDVSRITEGRIELALGPVSLAQVIAQAVESVEPLLAEKRHRLEIDVSAPPPYVNADHARIVQCVSNVLTNAGKYSDPGTRIRVKCGLRGGRAFIAIEDEGRGISAELLPYIFEPFVQGDRSIDRTLGGLGLGLAIVKRLIVMHGGTVSAHSDGVGRGTSVFIELSAARAPRYAAAKGDGPNGPVPRRVLVVDDNSDAADALGSLLSLTGHVTDVVYSATDALSSIGSFRPDVVLLDIGLPLMDGYALAGRIKEMSPSTAVVAVSGYGQEDDVLRARSAGFDRHLTKPVDLQRVHGVIAELLSD